MIANAGHGWRNVSTRGRFVECFDLLVSLMDVRWPGTRVRVGRIADACALVGARFCSDASQRYALRIAAMYHDVGMLGAPPEIDVAGAVPMPWLKEHTIIGGRVVHTGFPDFPEAIEAIWYHHERFDGKGPHKLGAELIPPFAGVIHAVSAIESMVAGRMNGDIAAPTDIARWLQSNRGKALSADVVSAAMGVLDEVYAVFTPKPKPEPESAPRAGGAESGEAEANGSENGRVKQRVTDARSQDEAAASLEDITPLLSKSDLRDAIRESVKLHPLAVTAHHVRAVLESPTCSIGDLATAVSHDQALALRVLRMAGSVAYASGRPVADIKDAVGRIGTQGVRNLLMALEVAEHLGTDHAGGIDGRLFWEHSLACGLLTSALSRLRHGESAEGAFLWGMLHDIGRLVLNEQFPEQYTRVVEVAKDLDLPLEVVERRLLNLDHAAILSDILEQWKFQQDAIMPMTLHHRSAAVLRAGGTAHHENAAMIAFADRLVHSMVLGSSANDVLYSFEGFDELTGVRPEERYQAARAVCDETTSLKLTILSRSTADPWPDCSKSIQENLPKALYPWYFPSGPSFDTVRMFFERISDEPKDDGPNLGVVCLHDEDDQERLYREVLQREEAAGIAPLPIAIFAWDSDIEIDPAPLGERAVAMLNLPVRIDRITSVIGELLI